MKREVKRKVVFTEGYRERFTEACIRVARRRVENQEKQHHSDSVTGEPAKVEAG